LADIATITAVTTASAQPAGVGTSAGVDSTFGDMLQDAASTSPQPAAAPPANIVALLQNKMLTADADAASLAEANTACAIAASQQAKSQPGAPTTSAAARNAATQAKQESAGSQDQIGEPDPAKPVAAKPALQVADLETDDATPDTEVADGDTNSKPAAPASTPDVLAAFLLTQLNVTATQNAPAPANDAAPVASTMAAKPQAAPETESKDQKDAPKQAQSSAETMQQTAAQNDKAAAALSKAMNHTADSRNSDPASNTAAPQLAAGNATAQPAAPAMQPGQPAVPVPGVAVTTAADVHAGKIAAQIQVTQQHHETVTTPDKLGLAIAAKSVDGVRHFDIRLDPPELGRVQVHLSMDDNGRAQASLVVDKPQTLELLQRDATSLNRALTDAGLDLSNNGLNFSLREQHRQNDDGGVDMGRGRSLSAKAVVQTDASLIHSSLSYAPDSVRLDIRV
jgi:flagellar hook-length control protein FliK